MKKRKKIMGLALVSLILASATAPAWGASYRPVLEQERGFVGATHVATFTYADLTETNAATAQTNSTVFTVKAKQRVELIGMELVTAFNAGDNATGSVCVIVGDGADPDFYLDSTELNSNKTEVWSKFGRAYQGITTATSVNMTNVALSTETVLTGVTIASEIDVLDSVTPSVAAALTGLGSATTTNAITALGTPTTVDAYTGFGAHTVTNVISGISLTLQTCKVYDSTGVACSNAATGGAEIEVVTNVTLSIDDVVAVIESLGTPTTAAAITGFGAPTTAAAVTAYASPTTANFVNGITSNVVQAAKTLSTSTASVVDDVTPQTESQTRVTALTGDAAGRKVYTADDAIDFVFTPNTENALSENTAGEVRFYFKVIR